MCDRTVVHAKHALVARALNDTATVVQAQKDVRACPSHCALPHEIQQPYIIRCISTR